MSLPPLTPLPDLLQGYAMRAEQDFIDALLARVDFLSIGSNDLMQFMFAVDRDNTRVSARFDDINPALVRALKLIVDKAGAAKVPVTLCGEMGGKPLEALALLAIGFRGLSMSPSGIGPVKAMIRALDLKDARAWLDDLLASGVSATSMKAEALAYAEARGIPV